MTVDETLKLIAQQWCNLSDLMKLANIGRNSVLTIKSKNKNNFYQSKKVIKYLNIDIDYLPHLYSIKVIAADLYKPHKRTLGLILMKIKNALTLKALSKRLEKNMNAPNNMTLNYK